MLKKIRPPFVLFISLILLGIYGNARADVGPKNGDTWVPAPSAPAPVDKNPLTVSDVLIDKTAANSVAAREQAIADAPAMAFQKLAERNLTEKQLKSLKVPKNVGALVQDFEIKGEQMSSTRYVAKFTVRFSDAVRNYIEIHETPVAAANAPAPAQPAAEQLTEENAAAPHEDEQAEEGAPDAAEEADGEADRNGVIWNDEQQGKAYTPPANNAGPLGRTALILPYLENMSGQTLLWEDPNPWRRIWQNALPNATVGGTQLIVPLGDINDIAAGASNAVWSGDYGPVEKLRRNYAADEVILLAANKSGSSMTVDVYTYQDGKLKHRGSITPFVGEKTDVEAFRQALADSLRYLAAGQQGQRRGKPSVETISREVVRRQDLGTTVIDGATPPPVNPPGTLILKPSSGAPPVQAQPVQAMPYAPAPVQYAQQAGGRMQLAATAIFRNFQAWVEMQKRLNGMAPMVAVDIRSLSSNSAEVTLNYSSSIEALQGELAARGLALGPTAGVDPVQGPVYRLQLVN